MCCQPGNRDVLASFKNRSTSSPLDKDATEMEPCKIPARTNASSHAQGAGKQRKYLLLPVEGRKMSLTSALIDQALAQVCAVCSPFCVTMSEMDLLPTDEKHQDCWASGLV